MTMTPVDHFWSLTFVTFVLVSFPIHNFNVHATPINRQVGISENVFITVQNDTYGFEQRVCSIDSMTYGDGETIPTASPCEHCVCRPPGFACTIISCEYRAGCKAFKRSNQCCPEYQCECEKDGKIYQNGEKIMDSNNPCEICYCQGGEIVCAVIDCYWRSDCQPRYIENRCCPLYDHCPPPPNQGPYQRPTIPTTASPAEGFPWFNLSSAVYEIPPGSSPTPVPILLESSTNPTTTPTPPELVVIATQKTPMEVNIMATAQEALLTNASSSGQNENESTQEEVKVQTEAPVIVDGQLSNVSEILKESFDAPSANEIGQPSEISTNEQLPSGVPVSGQQPSEVLVAEQKPSVSPVDAKEPLEILSSPQEKEQEKPDPVVNQEASESRPDTVNEIEVDPSTPISVGNVSQDSTTIFNAPAVAISIVPSPVEDIFVTQDAPVVTPEIESLIKDNEEPLKETISQSENAIQSEDGLIQPTESLPSLVSTIETETVSESVFLDPTLTSNVIPPTTTETEKSVADETEAPELSEVPTTGAPQLSTDEVVASVAHDEIVQNVEAITNSGSSAEQTTVSVDQTPELNEPENLSVLPIPSIATIIMPPKRDPVASEVTTNSPVITQDENAEDILVPSIELQPPSQEFVPGSYDDEVELSPTTDGSAFDDVPSVTQLPLTPEQENEVKVEEEIVNPSNEQNHHQDAPVDFNLPEVVTTQTPVHEESLAYLPIKKVETPFESVTTNSPLEKIVSDEVELSQNETVSPSQEFEIESSTVPAESVSSDEIAQTTPSTPEEASRETQQDEITQTTPSIPEEVSGETQQDVIAVAQKESIIPTTSVPDTLESTSDPQQPQPSVVVPLNTNDISLIDEDTFEIIPPQSDHVISLPEVLSQVRDPDVVLNHPVRENEVEATKEGEDSVVPPKTVNIDTKTNVEAPKESLDSEKYNIDDDTVEILAGNLSQSESESTTVLPVADKFADEGLVSTPVEEQNEEAKIQPVGLHLIQSIALDNDGQTASPDLAQKEADPASEDDDSDDLHEQIHPDDPEADSDQVVFTTTEVPSLNDETVTNASPIYDSATLEDHQGAQNDEPIQLNHPSSLPQEEVELDHEEIVQDEPSNLDQEEPLIPTTEASVQNDESDANIPVTTTVPEIVKKVQKVAEILKSKEEVDADVPIDSESDSKFRFDLSFLEDLAESRENAKKENVPSSSEVQSTATPLMTKVVNDEVVFDEAQQMPTHLPLAATTQENNSYQTTVRNIKLSRDDMELSDFATTVPSIAKDIQELQDDFEVGTTLSSARSELITDAPTTSSSFKSEETELRDESLQETTTVKASQEVLRQEGLEERTTVATRTEDILNDEESTSIKADASFQDFVEVNTGSPFGFAVEYRDDLITGESTTLRGSFKADSVTETNDETLDDVTTFETPVFDETQKLSDESIEIATTNEPIGDKAKAEIIEASTTYGPFGDKAKAESIEVSTTYEPTGDKAKVDSIEVSTTYESIGDKGKAENFEDSTTYTVTGDNLKTDTLEISTTYEPNVDIAKSESVEVSTTYEPFGDKAKAESIEVSTTYEPTEADDKAKAESIEVSTTYGPVDEKYKSESLEVTTTSEPNKVKAEDLEIETETTTDSVIRDDLDNEESIIATTEVAYSTLSDANETSEETTPVNALRGLAQMIIPAKGFPVIEPVSPDMIPDKQEDKLARLDIKDDDSWLLQTFNKIRQLSGLFPTSSKTQQRLVRQPRDLQNKTNGHAPSTPSKTFFKKTKKATEESINKAPKRRSLLPNRSFLFF